MYFCLWGVASPVVAIGGETHLILEPHHREQTKEATTSVPRPVLHQHRPIDSGAGLQLTCGFYLLIFSITESEIPLDLF